MEANRSDTEQTQEKTEMKHSVLKEGSNAVTAFSVSTSLQHYQNNQRLGVDGRQTPVSSPASQLHGSRHVLMEEASDVTGYLAYQRRQM